MSKEEGQVIIDGVAMKQKQQKETGSVLDKQIQKTIQQITDMKKNNIIQDNTPIQKKLEKTQQKLDNLVQDKVVVLDKQIKTLQEKLEKPNIQNRQETVKQIQKLQGEKILIRLQSKVGEKLDNVPPLLLQAYKDTLNLKQEELHAVETEKRKEKDPERRKKLESELERLKKELVALYNELLKKIKSSSSGNWFSNLWKPKPKPVKPLKIQVFRKLQAVTQDLRKTEQQLQSYETRIADPYDLMPTTPIQQQQINKKLTQLKNKINTLKQTKQELQREKLKEQKQLQQGIKRTLEPLTRPKFTIPTVSEPTLSPDTLRSLNRLVSKFSRSSEQEKPYTEKELIAKIRQQLQELKNIKQNLKTYSPEETEKIVKEQQLYRKDIMDLITLIGEKKQLIKRTRNIDYLDEMIVNLTTILNKFNKQRQTPSTQNVQALLSTAQLPPQNIQDLKAIVFQKEPQTRNEQKTQTIFQQESQTQEEKNKRQEQQKKFQELKKIKASPKLSDKQVESLRTASSIQALRKIYKDLSRIHHPDKGGNQQAMKQLSNLYEQRRILLQKQA